MYDDDDALYIKCDHLEQFILAAITQAQKLRLKFRVKAQHLWYLNSWLSGILYFVFKAAAAAQHQEKMAILCCAVGDVQ